MTDTLQDTLGSVGVIISTLMIKYTGWTVFDPIASLFIAALIMASVIPLVIDSGRVLCLDVGVGCEKEIETALADVSYSLLAFRWRIGADLFSLSVLKV